MTKMTQAQEADPFTVAGRRVLVTGSTRGIGLTIAKHLARAGAKVVLHGRDRETLATVVDEAGAVGFVTGDLRDAEQVKAVVEQGTAQLGGLDGLVNNAGGTFRARVEDLSQGGFEAILATNLTSAFLTCKTAHAHLVQHDGSAVVNISSLASIRPSPEVAHYAAAKAGLNQLTVSLAAEWAGSGIRVNAIVAGSIATDAALRENYGNDPERIAAAAGRIGVGRLGRPEDVATVTHFLLSEGSAFVNGAALVMDGGPPDEYVV